MENKKEEGLNALRNLTEKQKDDPKVLLDIDKKYGLGFGHIVEFCSNRLAKVIHAYENYLNPAVKDFSVGLEIIANKDPELKGNISNIIVPAAILSSYFGLDPKSSIQLVNEIDKANKKNAEEFGKKLTAGLVAGIHELARNKIYPKEDGKFSEPKDRFAETFNEGWNDTQSI